jgi:hypothetical protein
MADPTGTVGLTNESAPDLALATRGGPKFMQRLQQLGDAADRHEQALQQLALGQEAAAAFRNAAEQLEAAKRDRMAAAQELVNARRAASDILADAATERATAQDLRRAAEAQLSSAQDRERQAIEAGEAAKAAQRKAEAAEKKFNDKISRLKSELAKVA